MLSARSAARLLDKGQRVLVSTGDKDMAQLVTDGVTLVNTMNETVMDRDAVKAKFDVLPEQIIDYLALVGDTSDNIPGVPKVGAKTAAKWLNEYGSADEIIAHADDIKGKVGESLRDNIEQLRLSRELATIRQDLELPVTGDALLPSDADVVVLRKLYSHFELRTLLRQLDDADEEPEAPLERSEGDYETVLDWDAFDRWMKKLAQAELVALDTETTSLDYMRAEVVGLSVAVEAGRSRLYSGRTRLPGRAGSAAPRRGAREDARVPRGRRAGKGWPSPEVRRTRTGASWHRTPWHEVRFDAGVLRAQQRSNTP